MYTKSKNIIFSQVEYFNWWRVSFTIMYTKSNNVNLLKKKIIFKYKKRGANEWARKFCRNLFDSFGGRQRERVQWMDRSLTAYLFHTSASGLTSVYYTYTTI